MSPLQLTSASQPLPVRCRAACQLANSFSGSVVEQSRLYLVDDALVDQLQVGTDVFLVWSRHQQLRANYGRKIVLHFSLRGGGGGGGGVLLRPGLEAG